MLYFLLALAWTAGATGLGAVTDCLSSTTSEKGRWASTGIAAVINLVLGILINWGALYLWTPTFAGFSWVWMFILNLVITGACFGAANAATQRVSFAPITAVVLFVGLLIPAIWSGSPLNQDGADKLAKLTTVKVIEPGKDAKGQQTDPSALYPETDTDHILTVSPQNARFKANAVVNSSSFDSRYDLGEQSLVIVKQNNMPHAWYVHEVVINGFFDTKNLKYIVTGFIMVDAENDRSSAIVKKGFKFTKWRGGALKASLRRHIWSRGYKGVFTDNYRLQVGDQLNPYYTATVSTPALRWRESIPRAFLTINPTSGEIVKHELNKLPDWAEHVYSDTIAKKLMLWWGDFKFQDYGLKGRPKANRYKPEGEASLVVTQKGTLAWQIFMIPWSGNDKSSVSYTVLFNTRDRNDVTAYKAPPNLRLPKAAKQALTNATIPENRNTYDAASPTLYRVLNRLVYIADMVPNGTAQDGSPKEPAEQQSAGLGIIDATNVDAKNALAHNSKEALIGRFTDWLSKAPPSNAAPGSVALDQAVFAKIADVDETPYSIGGSTILTFTLAGAENKDRLFKLALSDNARSLSYTHLKPGDAVTVRFIAPPKTSAIGPVLINVKSLDLGDTRPKDATQPSSSAVPTPVPTS